MNKKPRVIIVGRMNVGKSTLFNRLSDRVKSMTMDYEGVTRDFVKDTISWQGRTFDIVDTGGINLRKTQDEILAKAREVALEQVKASDIVLFVVDGTIGLTKDDNEIARLLRKMGKNVILVVNKIDSKKSNEHQDEFKQLGFKDILRVSAEHARGIGDILDLLAQTLPEHGQGEEVDPKSRVVLLGKPNVGKSSLMNLILKKERSIVSDVAGTTREALSDKVSFYSEDILMTDTPGIRKKRAVTEDLETMMVKSSMRALNDANVVLLLIDASEGKIADQELKLAFYAFTEKFKALALLFNKEDLATEDSRAQLKHSMSEYEFVFKKVPQLSISCATGKNIGKVLPLIKELVDRGNQQFNEDDLKLLFKTALMHKPLYHNGNMLIFYGARQIKSQPITIVLIVNEPKWFGPSQIMFFENILRAEYNLSGVPVKFFVRKRG
jgi:GTP-binding protein